MFVIAYPEPRIRAPRYYRADEARDVPAPAEEAAQSWVGRRMQIALPSPAWQRYWQATPADPIPVDTTAFGGPSRTFFLVRLRRY